MRCSNCNEPVDTGSACRCCGTYDDPDEETKDMTPKEIKKQLYNFVAEHLLEDATGSSEHLKEFWEECPTSKDVKTAEKMLKELAKKLKDEVK